MFDQGQDGSRTLNDGHGGPRKGHNKARAAGGAGALVLVLVLLGLRGAGALMRTGGFQSPSEASAAEAELATIVETYATEGVVPEASDRDMGAAGQIVEITRRHFQEMDRILKDYQHKLDLIRIDAILLPARLDSAEEIADSRTRLDRVRESFREASARQDSLNDRTRQRIEALGVSKAQRQRFVEDFQRGIDAARPATEMVAEYERESYDALEAVLDICEGALGRIQESGGYLLFDDEHDLLLYNLELRRLDEIIVRQATLQEQLIDLARDTDGEQSARSLVPGPSTDRFAITQRGLRLGDEHLGVPTTLAELEASIDKADRVEIEGPDAVHCWDDRGLVACVERKSGRLAWITAATNLLSAGADPFEPKAAFGGRIVLFGQPVTDYDSPVSTNRRFNTPRFEVVSEDGLLWAITGDKFDVYMGMSDNAIAYGLTFVPHQPVDPNAARPQF